MSKRLLCLVPYFLALFWLLQFTQSAVSQSWTQAASYGGSGNDIGTAIRVSEHGDRYVTGSFSTVASFGGNTLTSAGGTDIFLARYARDGQLLWVVQAGGSGDDSGFDLALDKAGNTYVTGWFVGPGVFWLGRRWIHDRNR